MFSKKSGQESKPVAATRSLPESTFSMLGADLSIKGNLTASADLHIDGKVEGDIGCASLVQGESSVITGGVTAKTARLSGKVEGSISCAELVILKSARIHGDVHYDTLTIEQGAIIDGRLSPHVTDLLGDRASTRSDEEALILANAAE